MTNWNEADYPRDEDIKKLARRVKTNEKEIAKSNPFGKISKKD